MYNGMLDEMIFKGSTTPKSYNSYPASETHAIALAFKPFVSLDV